VEHMLGTLFADEAFARAVTAANVAMMRGYDPDVVVDSFGLFTCLAARILKRPLATVLQGNFHPASRGFLWWKDHRPAGLPSAVGALNAVAGEYGLAPNARCVDLLAGDLDLIVGTPETDPVEGGAQVTHVGPIVWQRGDAALPDGVAKFGTDRPLIWVYSGNPRYARAPTPVDSIVVIRAAIAAFAHAPVQVVLTTGYQALPRELGALPSNFHHAAYLPGPQMAARCDLLVHHGGHGSVMTGLAAGTPAVIIPTITERESNARRVAALGAGEVVLPSTDAHGEKQVDSALFGAHVERVLGDPGYALAARRVAKSMQSYGGARDAADRIERFSSGL